IAANTTTITIYALTLSALSTLFAFPSTFFLYINFSLSTPLIYLTVFPQYIPILVPIITLTHPNIAPTIIHIVAGDSSIPPIFNNSYYINNYLVLTIFFTFLLLYSLKYPYYFFLFNLYKINK